MPVYFRSKRPITINRYVRQRRGGFVTSRTTATQTGPMYKRKFAFANPINKKIQKAILSRFEGKYRAFRATVATDIRWDVPLLFALSDVPQGNTDITRIGDKLTPTSLEVNYLLQVSQGATTNVGSIRVTVFRWHPYYDTETPALGNIFSATGDVAAYQSPINHDDRNQFNILYDKIINLNSKAKPQRQISFKMSLANKPCSYRAGSTTAVSEGIYTFFTSDNATAGLTQLVSADCRLNYKDG